MKISNRFILGFAVITALWLIINLILVPFNWEIVFHDIATTAGIEIVMLFGFLLAAVFDLTVIGWIINRLRSKSNVRHFFVLLLGSVLCLLALFAAKVMADDIGRQSRYELGASGEYVMFNIFVGLQVLYNFYFIGTILKMNRTAI